MKLKVNDKEILLNELKPCVSDLLRGIGRTKTDGIAVAVNQVVVPRESWSVKILNQDDEVVIIQATQGG